MKLSARLSAKRSEKIEKELNKGPIPELFLCPLVPDSHASVKLLTKRSEKNQKELNKGPIRELFLYPLGPDDHASVKLFCDLSIFLGNSLTILHSKVRSHIPSHSCVLSILDIKSLHDDMVLLSLIISTTFIWTMRCWLSERVKWFEEGLFCRKFGFNRTTKFARKRCSAHKLKLLKPSSISYSSLLEKVNCMDINNYKLSPQARSTHRPKKDDHEARKNRHGKTVNIVIT